ncbi:hypothetical protein MTO96_034244 [Rhipicephalus appendiculatus]
MGVFRASLTDELLLGSNKRKWLPPRRDPGDAVLSRNCNSLINTLCSLLFFPAFAVTAVFLLLERTRDPKIFGLRAYEELDHHGLADWGNISDFLPISNHASPLRGEILDVGDALWNVGDVNFTEEEPEIPVKLHWMTVAEGHHPRSSVAVGYDGRQLYYAGRADRGDAWTPCLVHQKSRPACVSSLSSGLVSSSYFQYLLETEGLLLSWAPAGHHGAIPDGAVRADPDASGDVIVFARQLKYDDEGLPSGGLLSSARRVLTGLDGVARTPSPYLQVLTKRLDAFPSERWLPAALPVNVPLYPARIQGNETVYWRVGRTVHRGETLPCFADKHGCLVAKRSDGNCNLAPTFEYLALSRGTRYRWHPLPDSAGRARALLGSFSETEQVVIVGHGRPNRRLLVARASHYGLLVLGYLAVDGTGSVVGGGEVIGCDPRGPHHSALVSAHHDVKVLIKTSSRSS